MVLLIDANIILDVLLNRPEFVKESSLVWKLCETEQAKGYISALTFANLVYIMRKQLTPEKIEDVLQRLGLIFEFADLTSADVSKAAALHWADFEDAVQSVTAERIHANYIITRNVRDFTKSSVMAFTPAELLVETLRPVSRGTSTVAPNMANMCWTPRISIRPAPSWRAS